MSDIDTTENKPQQKQTQTQATTVAAVKTSKPKKFEEDTDRTSVNLTKASNVLKTMDMRMFYVIFIFGLFYDLILWFICYLFCFILFYLLPRFYYLYLLIAFVCLLFCYGLLFYH
jgi:hypothetical protein